MKKTLLCILLAVCLVMSLLPVASLADTATAKVLILGTEELSVTEGGAPAYLKNKEKAEIASIIHTKIRLNSDLNKISIAKEVAKIKTEIIVQSIYLLFNNKIIFSSFFANKIPIKNKNAVLYHQTPKTSQLQTKE